MIPKYGTYFGDLLSQRDDPYFQVELTTEGHACQHDVLYKVFGDGRDKGVQNLILQSSNKAESGRKGGLNGAGKPKPKTKPPEHGRHPFSPLFGRGPDGTEHFFAGPAVAARHMGGNPSAISACASGKRQSHHGWVFWR